MEFLGSVNNLWGFLAVIVVYAFTEYGKRMSNRRKSEQRSDRMYKKLNTISEEFSEIKGSLKEHVDIDKKFQANTEIQIKGLVVLQMLQHAPKRRRQIERLYDEYKSLGGNSYVDDLYAEWDEKNGRRDEKVNPA